MAALVGDRVSRLEGRVCALRLIEPEDADYVYALRTDPRFNLHLSRVDGTVADQRAWIERYKLREARGSEYYYVIEGLDGTRCGLVRLYDIEADRFTWGSWILDENKPRKAALESALLSFGFGFETLGLETALVDVRLDNARARSIYEWLGMRLDREDETDAYFVYEKAAFVKARRELGPGIDAQASA